MSVADRLGTGSSFTEARHGRSARGRAKAVTQGDVPAYELVRLRLAEVSPTPLNPRRNFGTDDDKTRFGEELRQAQLAACVAVSRASYLTLWPEHEGRIGSAAHVLVNGERRFHSAVHVGLEALDFVVRDDLASSRESFVDHLLKENLEREDFDVIERARGVEQLVAVCAEQSERGARTRAAERLHKDRSWVTNQLVLLSLPGEIQSMLSAGSLAERDGRLLARHAKDRPGIGAAELLAHLDFTKAAAAQVKADEQAEIEALRSVAEAGLLSADNKPGVQDDVRGMRHDNVREGAASQSLSTENNQGEEVHNEERAPRRPRAMHREVNSLSADNKPQSSAGHRVPAQQYGVPGRFIALREPERIAADLFNLLSEEDLAHVIEALVQHQSNMEGRP